MEIDSLHDTAVLVVDGDPGGSIGALSNNDGLLEEKSSNKEVMREIGSDVLKLGRDLAFCSEKLVNMNLLMMRVAAKECDFEAFTVEKEDLLVNSAEVALEFDILSGLFDLEIKEMDNFIGRLQMKFRNACDAFYLHKHLEIGFLKLEEKLHDAEKSLKQSQEQVSELMMQSAKFQRIVSSASRDETSDEDGDMGLEANVDFFNTTAKLQMQTSEQQRHILSMLEKSLARELDLENQLQECMQTLDKMKRKLYNSRTEVLSVEEEMMGVYARFLEADNASAVLMATSKELIGQIQSCQLIINSSLRRESDLNAKLQNCNHAIQKLEKEELISQDVVKKNSLDDLVLEEKVNSLEEQLKASEFTLLDESVSLNDANKKHEKIDSLEEKLRETEFQLQQAMVSIEASQEKQSMFCSSLEDMEIVIEKLKTNVLSAESRAATAESESFLLAETNNELTEELDLLKTNSISDEKFASLDKQLRATNIQLQRATTSIEYSQEKLTKLYSEIDDKEILIEKLKSKVLEANARADNAEDKWIMLSENHEELSNVLDFLRGKVECLEVSLKQVEEKKLAASTDIDTRTKIITDLVMQLALERERLQNQISWLVKDNRGPKNKLQKARKPSSYFINREIQETDKGVVSSENHIRTFHTKGERSIPGTTEVDKSADDIILDDELNCGSQGLNSKLQTVRTIDVGWLNFRYVLSASLIASVAVLATCFFSPENCLF